jgi:predicted enzyme related to lactoylglutathione lyase
MDVVVAKLGLVLDCSEPEKLADFWAPALGYDVIGTAGSYVLLMAPGGGSPQLLLQRVPEGKAGKNRMHFDIHVADIEAEAGRLVELGAARVEAPTMAEHGTNWVLMTDPEGNEFCVCDGGTDS